MAMKRVAMKPLAAVAAAVSDETEEVETEDTMPADQEGLPPQLFKVSFRRLPQSVRELATRSRVYMTWGVTEEDAITRIWNAYSGSSFQKEFSRDNASAEIVIGGVYKIAGN